MNTLFVSHSGWKGGATSMLLEVIREFIGLGEVHCVVPSRGNLADELELLGVTVHKIGLKWFAGEDASQGKKIASLIYQYKIDLVITNTITVADGALAALVTRTPHIWYIHEILSGDPALVPSVPLEFIYKSVLSMSSIVVAISQAVKREIEKYAGPSNKIQVVHNGIQVNGMPSKRTYDPVVLTAGGICRRKGQMTLLKAARHVIDAIPGAKFMSVGGPWERDYFDSLRRERKRLGLTRDQFVFNRVCHDMPTYYKTGAVFALTSDCEPFGLVLLEAMREGLPVVATRSGGPQEIIHDGITGWLVNVGNDVELGNTLVYLLQHPMEADQMGQAGFESVRSGFSRNKFVSNFMCVIDVAMGAGAKLT